MLCCLANGFKFPPMIIFKEGNGQIPKKLKDTYDNSRVVLKGNKSGWMTSKVLEEWIKEVWEPNIEEGTSYLLIWDSFSCHKNLNIINCLLEEYDTQVEIIPRGCTSVLQPLDVGINESLKSIIKRNFEDWKIARQDLPPSNLFALE